MATYTSRYGLSKPEATDEMQSFMSDYADNMDKIDENLGGGGGSANIVELTQAEYDALPDSKLSDDTMYLIKDLNSASDAEFTHVYGLYLDPNNVINSSFIFDSTEHSWTATADCILTGNMVPHDGSTAYYVRLDGVQVFAGYSAVEDPFVYVKKGQAVTYRGKSGSSMKAYGVVAGSEVTFLSEYASACYSTQEREVGCWIDGKPLYQKAFAGLSVVLGSDWVNAIDISSMDMENCILGIGVVSNSYQTPLCTRINGNYLQAYMNGMGGVTITTIVIQYTKTTDVAGSGQWTPMAQPTHHYSTSEQVIGTWIDGKPLYERSFVKTLSGSPDVNGDSFLVASGISDIDTLVKIDGTVKENNNYAFFGYSGIADANSGWRYSFHLNPDSQLVVWTSNNSQCWIHVANGKAVCTIQYTKTTD